jgi:hypothetical protein
MPHGAVVALTSRAAFYRRLALPSTMIGICRRSGLAFDCDHTAKLDHLVPYRLVLIRANSQLTLRLDRKALQSLRLTLASLVHGARETL